MPTTDPLPDLTRAALAVLSAWGRAASAKVLAAADEALAAGGEPAVAVVATKDGLPEIVLCMRAPDGVLIPFATAHAGMPVQHLQ